jgi:hypothetical protein
VNGAKVVVEPDTEVEPIANVLSNSGGHDRVVLKLAHLTEVIIAKRDRQS